MVTVVSLPKPHTAGRFIPVPYKFLLLLLLLCAGLATRSLAQKKVDSIYFNLYTDSLKKGVHNYINVDGKMSDGSWLPLTAKEVEFSATDGKFDGNSLILDTSFKGRKVTITAILKANKAVQKEVTIYIKTVPDNERLRTVDEILNRPSTGNRRNKKS